MHKKNKPLLVILVMTMILTLGIGLIYRQTDQQIKRINAKAGGGLIGGSLEGRPGGHQYDYFPRDFLWWT